MIHSNQAAGSLIQDIVKDKKTIKLNTSINVYRGYLNAEDMVVWLLTILNYSNYKCPIFNVGSSTPTNIRALAKLIGKIYKKKIVLKKLNNKIFDYYVPSTTKANRLLKLKTWISLNKSVNLIRNYKYEKNFNSNTNI